MIRIEAGVGAAQRPEGANHEAGADQEHEGERDFGDNERVAGAAAAGVAIGFAQALLERIVEIAAEQAGAGEESGCDAGENRRDERECQHAPLELGFGGARQLCGGGLVDSVWRERATSRPSAPPAMARSMVSVKTGRSPCRELAPSAAR